MREHFYVLFDVCIIKTTKLIVMILKPQLSIDYTLCISSHIGPRRVLYVLAWCSSPTYWSGEWPFGHWWATKHVKSCWNYTFRQRGSSEFLKLQQSCCEMRRHTSSFQQIFFIHLFGMHEYGWLYSPAVCYFSSHASSRCVKIHAFEERKKWKSFRIEYFQVRVLISVWSWCRSCPVWT